MFWVLSYEQDFCQTYAGNMKDIKSIFKIFKTTQEILFKILSIWIILRAAWDTLFYNLWSSIKYDLMGDFSIFPIGLNEYIYLKYSSINLCREYSSLRKLFYVNHLSQVLINDLRSAFISVWTALQHNGMMPVYNAMMA